MHAATTPALVAAAAERWPTEEALVDGELRLTFAALRDEVERSARAAMAWGLRRGDRVAIWAPNSASWMIAALGVHAAGGVLVPLNTRYKGDEAAYVLERSGARLLFTVENFLGTDYADLLRGRATGVERTVAFGTAAWEEYLSATCVADLPPVSEDSLSDIIFTSGTTGRPKGVMTTHGQTVEVFRAWSSVIGLRAGDRYLVASPFFHTFGYKAGFVAAIDAGATTIPLPVVDVPAILDLVSRERVTVLPGSPTIFQSLLDHPDRAAADLSSLRLSAVGAASVPQQLVERMRDELFDTVVTGYGLTETTGVVTMSRPEDPPEVIARSVGRALPGVDVRVVDDEGDDAPAGTPGEVVVRGFNVMLGYFDDPEQTAAAIDTDGWLHTGDIGVLDDDGYLAITDRLKDMFIVGGFNAYPAEIEAALLRHPDLAMAAVVGVPDERLGEVGMAFVVPKPGAAPTPEQIVGWAKDEMANFKVPRRVVVVEALPLNAMGKVLKGDLRTIASQS